MDYTLRLKWWPPGNKSEQKVELSGVMDALTFSLTVGSGEVKIARVETGMGRYRSSWQGIKFLFHLSVEGGAKPEDDSATLIVHTGVPKDTEPFTVKVILWNESYEEILTPHREDDDMSEVDQEWCEWYVCEKQLRRR